jgi:two-component system, NarL family, sensor kinase
MRTRRSLGWSVGILILLSLPMIGLAQVGVAERTAVLAGPEDTVKVMGLSDLCYAYRRVDGDSAIAFGEQALVLARKLRFRRGEAQALNDLAIIHADRSEYGQAEALLRTALTIRSELRDEVGMAAVYNKLGILFQSQHRLEDALEEDRKAFGIYERLGMKAQSATMLNNIAIIQFNLRQYQPALATHGSALEIRRGLQDTVGVAHSLSNIGNVLVLMGGDTALALRYYKDAATCFRDRGLARELATELHNDASVRLYYEGPGPAIPLFQEALELRKATQDRKAIASSTIGLAEAYLMIKETTRAWTLARSALSEALQVNARIERLRIYRTLARIHGARGAADSVVFYHERYIQLQDSVFDQDMTERIAVLETRLGLERKEQELQLQRADNAAQQLQILGLQARAQRRNFLMALALGAALIVVLAAIGVLQFQRRRARAQKDAAVIAEREVGLKAMVERTDAERTRIAAELHDGVGQSLTGLKFRVEAATRDEPRLQDLLVLADEAAREVRDIAHRIMPRALADLGLVPAIGDMLQRSLKVPGMHYEYEHFGMEQRLPASVEVGVYRICQELVNNLIKHARATNVDVQLLQNKGHLVLIVEDDGVGIEPERMSAGLGMRSLQDRARALKGTLDIERGAERGTVATLRIPLNAISHT